jgi:hypothetical protein
MTLALEKCLQEKNFVPSVDPILRWTESAPDFPRRPPPTLTRAKQHFRGTRSPQTIGVRVTNHRRMGQTVAALNRSVIWKCTWTWWEG